MKPLLRICIFLSLLVMLLACESNDDSVPVVRISFPPAEYQISIPDTISIKGEVRDEEGINFIKIQLVNDQLLDPFLLFSKNLKHEKLYNFDISSVVYDSEIPTGNYYIKATAYNDNNVSSDFVKVYVNEAALELEKIIVCSKEPSNTISVKTIDNSLNIQRIMDYEGAFVASAINSSGKQLFVSLNQPSVTYSLDLIDGLPGWTEQAHQPHPYFNDLILHDYIIYLATENGEIFGMDINHNPKFNTLTNPDTVPEKLIIFNNYLISASRKRVGGNRQLMVYYKESGSFIQRKSIQDSILAFYAINEEQLICFANQEKGNAFLFNPQSNHISEANNFDFKIRYSAQISDTRFLLATEDKVYLYALENHTLIPVINQPGLETIAYEPLRQQILLATDNRICIVGYPGYDLVAELEWNPEVEKIDFLYNKKPDF